MMNDNKLTKEKYVEDCHPPIIVSNNPRLLTHEEKEVFMSNLIKKYREEHKLFPPTKLMYLQYAPAKQVNRNSFYILAFIFVFALIPSLYLGLTLTNIIGTFIISFPMTLNFYDGFIWKDTVVAHSD
jgi:hypothetical protein